MNPDRVILVTGASKGVGRALAANLTAAGHQVFGISRTDSDLRAVNYHHISADISDESAVRDAFDTIRDRAGRLDILINNAGLKANGYALLTTAGQANDMLATNLFGTFMVTREAVKLMKRNGFGRVITFSSVAVPMGGMGCAIYSATKAGVMQFHHALAQEHAGEDITFNTVGISIYEDSAMVDAIDAGALEDMQAHLLKPTTLSIDEIRDAVAFFAADTAANITNQVVYFGGVR